MVVHRGQRQANLCELKATLVYIVSYRIAMIHRHCLGKNNETNKQTKNLMRLVRWLS